MQNLRRKFHKFNLAQRCKPGELILQKIDTKRLLMATPHASQIVGSPALDRVRRPKKKVTYSFSPIGQNAMVLLPPENMQESGPQYYISISSNCFMPLSHITTVYRGENEYAPRVGEFE